MAEQDPQPENIGWIDDLVARLSAQFTGPATMERGARAGENLLIAVATTLFYAMFRVTSPIATAAISGLLQANDETKAERAKVLALSLRSIFGATINESDIAEGFASGTGAAASSRVVVAMMKALTGGSESIEPSEAPAQRYVQVVLQQALEGWFTGTSMELMSGVIPYLEQVQLMGEAGTKVAQALGIGDSSSRVLRPYIDNLVVEPLRRAIDSKYRPTLLSAAEAARQIHRGRGNADVWREEMRVQGYSEEKIETIIASQQKYLSESQLAWLEWRNLIDHGEAIQTLRDQGWDEQTASKRLLLYQFEQEEDVNGRIASAAMAAYEHRRIDRAELTALLAGSITSARERGLLLLAADARRAVNRKLLSEGDAEAAVVAGIWAFIDLRDWLRREGYDEEAILVKELLLRHRIEKDAAIAELRATANAERAAEKLARELEKAKRKEEVEDERRLRRRGPLGLLERAAVRGLIPFSRVEEVLAPEYDADTVRIFIDAIEIDRQTYLEQQQRAEDAKQRGRRRDLDTGTLETAVFAGTLTLEEYARHPVLMAFSDPDRAILVATLTAKVADRRAALDARAKADQEAKRRTIDLGRAEQLVLRGVRPMTQYVDLLRSLGFDAGAIAAIVELLELRIADAADARRIREDKERELAVRGISLEEFRRGVVLGVKTLDQFETFMVQQRFTTDAQLVLLAQLRDDLAEAEAARRRRAERDRDMEPRALPLATVRRAAQLGVISPASYQARLVAEGFSADDIALELELLLLEIADVQASRRRRDALEPDAAGRGLSLAEIEQAVKAGTATLPEYRARAVTAGYSAAAVDALVALLEAELETQADAARRRDAIDGELVTRELSLGQLEDAVKNGFKSLDQFAADLRTLGYGSDDTDLLVALLTTKLDRAAATG